MNQDQDIFKKIEEMVVLVVDDDAMVVNIMVEYLKSFGFKYVLDAKDGKRAMKYIQDPQQRIDVVISDWEMPKMDGHQLLKAIRAHHQRADVKFIMVTSQNSRERIKISQARQLRVDAYIVKPFRGEILREKLLQILGLTKKTDTEKKAV